MQKTYQLSEIKTVAKAVIEAAEHKILAFYGEMGVGKTTLIKEIALQLGVNELTNSPTFAIVNEYRTENDVIYHFDCYRMEDEEEAYDIGLEDYLYSGAWCFIEWPERIENILPEELTKITINHEKNTIKRVVQLEN